MEEEKEITLPYGIANQNVMWGTIAFTALSIVAFGVASKYMSSEKPKEQTLRQVLVDKCLGEGTDAQSPLAQALVNEFTYGTDCNPSLSRCCDHITTFETVTGSFRVGQDTIYSKCYSEKTILDQIDNYECPIRRTQHRP